MLHHRPDTSPQPCLQCAQVGHATNKCPTPKEDWNSSTITVTKAQIQTFRTQRQRWKTLADVQAIFKKLAKATPTTPETTKSGAAEDKSTTADTGGKTDSSSAAAESGTPEHNQQHGKAGGEQPQSGPSKQGVDDPSPQPTDQLNSQTFKDNVQKPSNTKIMTEKQLKVNSRGTAHTAPQRQAQEWKTAGKRESSVSTTTPQTPKPRRSQPTARETNVKPTVDKRNSNSYIDLVSEEGDSDSESDSEDSDYEDDKPADIKTRTNPTRVTGQGIGQHIRDQPEASDKDVLERATQQARMEKVRIELLRRADELRPQFDLQSFTAAISTSRPHIATKSSTAWILSAIGGRSTDTPSTGNCQWYAMTEALHQTDMKLLDNDRQLVEATMLYKYGLLPAHLACSETDRRSNHMAIILSTPADTPATETKHQELARITAYCKSVATSGSTRNVFLRRTNGAI